MAEEKKIGIIEKFFAKIGVAAIRITEDGLRVGDTIRIKGHTTDLEMKIESMQIEHAPVQKADPGESVGIRTPTRVREHDAVYKVIQE
ncbi:MAG: translation elongation factor-like protein [bacterium]